MHFISLLMATFLKWHIFTEILIFNIFLLSCLVVHCKWFLSWGCFSVILQWINLGENNVFRCLFKYLLYGVLIRICPEVTRILSLCLILPVETQMKVQCYHNVLWWINNISNIYNIWIEIGSKWQTSKNEPRIRLIVHIIHTHSQHVSM